MKFRSFWYSSAYCVLTAALANGDALTQGTFPLVFEKNQGQTDRRVDFLSRGNGYTLFLTQGHAVLRLKDSVVRMRLLGASKSGMAEGQDVLPGRSNYLFDGGDKSKWRTNIRQYGRVRYPSVYRGVDLVYYGNQKQLEYDFVVAPGADPAAIKLQFDGAKRVKVDGQGDLIVSAPGGDLRFHRPVVYQDVNGKRVIVAGGFRASGQRVSFDIGRYQRDLPLVIDPVLSYSTYLGGSSNDQAVGIGVDGSGNVYVGGTTSSTNFPATTGAIETQRGTGQAIFVTKLNPTGTSLLYSTFLGGTSNAGLEDIAVDPGGNVYLTGYGQLTATAGAYKPCSGCTFAAKITPGGNQLSYLTGLDIGTTKLAPAADGSLYIAGRTEGTLTSTVGAYQRAPAGVLDVAVLRLNSTGSRVIYATYLGGTADDYLGDIAVDGSGNTYVTGWTQSNNFPTTSGVVHASGTADVNGFVTKLNAEGTALVYSTMLRSTRPVSIAVHSGEVYVSGFALAGFESTAGAYSPSGPGFVAKLNSTATAFTYATYVDVAGVLAVDSGGNTYIAGNSNQYCFSPYQPCPPTTSNAFQPNRAGGVDAYIAKFNPSGSVLLYATYLGGSADDSVAGIALDASGNLYVAGTTSSTNLPSTPGAYSATSNGGTDVFVAKIDSASIACTYTLSATSTSFTSAAASNMIGVTANSGCVWVSTVASDSSWVHVTSGGSGIGSGVVSYTVDANNSTQPRQGVVTIAGQTFTISQAGAACTYSIAPQSLIFDSEGGISNVAVIAPQGCTWTALSNASWITISSGQSGNGPGSVRYAVAASTGASRTGTLTIAGQTFTVTQGTAGCSYALSSNSQAATASGATYSVGLTAGSGCAWIASSGASWIAVINTAGTGSAAISYTVAANPGPARTGTLTVGGRTVTINQSGNQSGNCLFSLSPSTITTSSTGGIYSAILTLTGAQCRWVVQQPPSVTANPGEGTAAGTFNQTFTVYPNFSTQARTMTVQVGTATMTISQSGSALSSNERFVQLVYFAFLGRLPAGAELAARSAALNAGSTRADMVVEFFGSDEFNAKGRFVAGLYVGLLNRDAEFNGWIYQRGALQTGAVTLPGLVTNFINSPEFQLQNGALDNESYVRLLYRQVLLREPNPAEVAGQAVVLSSGGNTRTNMAFGFLASPEFQGGAGPRLIAFLLHAGLLQRDPSGAERSALMAQIQAGATIRNAALNILNSDEFGNFLK